VCLLQLIIAFFAIFILIFSVWLILKLQICRHDAQVVRRKLLKNVVKFLLVSQTIDTPREGSMSLWLGFQLDDVKLSD
jgi:hypothetical protein